MGFVAWERVFVETESEQQKDLPTLVDRIPLMYQTRVFPAGSSNRSEKPGESGDKGEKGGRQEDGVVGETGASRCYSVQGGESLSRVGVPRWS